MGYIRLFSSPFLVSVHQMVRVPALIKRESTHCLCRGCLWNLRSIHASGPWPPKSSIHRTNHFGYSCHVRPLPRSWRAHPMRKVFVTKDAIPESLHSKATDRGICLHSSGGNWLYSIRTLTRQVQTQCTSQWYDSVGVAHLCFFPLLLHDTSKQFLCMRPRILVCRF